MGGDVARGGVVGVVWAAVDLEGSEDGGVEELAGLVTDAGVEPFGVAEQVDDLFEPVADFVGGGLGGIDETFGVGDLGCTFTRLAPNSRVICSDLDPSLRGAITRSRSPPY